MLYKFRDRQRTVTSNWLRPMVLCGQHSLPLFCFGVFLSFAAHWFLVQYSHSVWAQLLVSFGGMLTMVGLAWLLDRTRKVPNLFVDASGIGVMPETAAKQGAA